jgi:hypothetical protein
MPSGPTLRSTRGRGESRGREVHGRRDREGGPTRLAGRALEGAARASGPSNVRRASAALRIGERAARTPRVSKALKPAFSPRASRRRDGTNGKRAGRPREGYGSRRWIKALKTEPHER